MTNLHATTYRLLRGFLTRAASAFGYRSAVAYCRAVVLETAPALSHLNSNMNTWSPHVRPGGVGPVLQPLAWRSSVLRWCVWGQAGAGPADFTLSGKDEP